LRKAADFIRATEIYAEGMDVLKKTKVPVDWNSVERIRGYDLKA